MRNHLWCPNDPRSQGINDDDDDDDDGGGGGGGGDDDDDDGDDDDDESPGPLGSPLLESSKVSLLCDKPERPFLKRDLLMDFFFPVKRKYIVCEWVFWCLLLCREVHWFMGILCLCYSLLSPFLFQHARARAHIHTHTHTLIHARVLVHTQSCTQTHTHTHAHARVRAHTRTHSQPTPFPCRISVTM